MCTHMYIFDVHLTQSETVLSFLLLLNHFSFSLHKRLIADCFFYIFAFFLSLFCWYYFIAKIRISWIFIWWMPVSASRDNWAIFTNWLCFLLWRWKIRMEIFISHSHNTLSRLVSIEKHLYQLHQIWRCTVTHGKVFRFSYAYRQKTAWSFSSIFYSSPTHPSLSLSLCT